MGVDWAYAIRTKDGKTIYRTGTAMSVYLRLIRMRKQSGDMLVKWSAGMRSWVPVYGGN